MTWVICKPLISTSLIMISTMCCSSFNPLLKIMLELYYSGNCFWGILTARQCKFSTEQFTTVTSQECYLVDWPVHVLSQVMPALHKATVWGRSWMTWGGTEKIGNEFSWFLTPPPSKKPINWAHERGSSGHRALSKILVRHPTLRPPFMGPVNGCPLSYLAKCIKFLFFLKGTCTSGTPELVRNCS